MVKIKFKPAQIIALFFAVVAITGTLLLALPISHHDSLSFIDSFFIATSATCVTGLSTVNVTTTFTIFGKIIIALLIQIGGLGYAALATIILTVLRQRTSVKQLNVVKASMNVNNLNDIKSLLKFVITFTFIAELIGFILSYLSLVSTYGYGGSIGYALFHSISSFNNAGFDIFGTTSSLVIFSSNIELLIVTMTLIVVGGLGFFVHKDLRNKRTFSTLTLHSKIVLVMTFSLIIIGTILIMLSGTSFINSLFTSITTRTAGFSTIDMGKLPGWTIAIVIVFMLIGASPGSTGGGMKTTTVFVMFISILTIGSDKGPISFKRRIRKRQAITAFQIFFLTIVILFLGTLLLQVFNPELDLRDIVFESVSAFATVGLSTGVTSSLHSISKIVIIILMYVGRIGPITLILSLINKTDDNKGNLGYIEEAVFLG